jgi:hypothetical protein
MQSIVVKYEDNPWHGEIYNSKKYLNSCRARRVPLRSNTSFHNCNFYYCRFVPRMRLFSITTINTDEKKLGQVARFRKSVVPPCRFFEIKQRIAQTSSVQNNFPEHFQFSFTDANIFRKNRC